MRFLKISETRAAPVDSSGTGWPSRTSPSVFINTLPNVVLGEIAVKNGVKGETTLVMLPERDEATLQTVVDVTLAATRPAALICGWVDCTAEDTYFADLKIIKNK